VIIDDLNVGRARRSIVPLEANPPLIVDADGVLALPIAFESFQPIARQSRKVSQAGRRFQPVKADFGLPGKTGKFPDTLSIGEARGPIVPEAGDHRRETYFGLRFT
jgi:hypothetical protein